MTETLPVKEHLRNEALYRSLSEPSLSEEWKRRLFSQYTLHEQLRAALWERPHFLKRFVCIGVPIICIALVFTSYFGFIDLESWFEGIVPILSLFENIAPILDLEVPSIGLKEVFIFVAIVNALTFIIRKRVFAL
jgi:hypothetical protein